MILSFVGPAVEVRVVDPFLPNHRGHGARQNGLVSNGRLHHLRWARRAMVIAIHRGLHHPWLHRINGEGATQRGWLNDGRAVERHQTDLPSDIAVGKWNGLREVPKCAVQGGRVAHRRPVPVKGEFGVAVHKSTSIVDVFIADLNGDVHRFTAPEVDTRRAHVNAVFRKDDAFELEVVLVALKPRATPSMSKRNGDHPALHHQPRGGGELLLIVPCWSESERDVRHHVGAVFGDLNGVRRMEFHEGSIAQTGRGATGVGEQERGLVRFAVHVKSMMRDGPTDDLVLRGNRLPFLGRRQDGFSVNHGAVLQQHGAGGLQAEHLNRQTATGFRHEGKRDGLHSTHAGDRCSRLVHAHHEGRRGVSHEMLACLVSGSKAAENRDTVARHLNANFGKGRVVNVNRIGGVGQRRVEHGEFAAVEVEQAGRCCVGRAVGHQRVLDEESDLKHRAGRGRIAETERGEVLGGNPQPGVARSTGSEGELHLFLSVGEAVLPTPRAYTRILTTPFVPLIKVEVEGWPSGVLATEEVHGERFSVPSGEIAHVAIGGKHRHDTGLHANRALVGHGEVRQADVHPSVLRVEAHLNLAACDRAVEFRVVQRCVGQHPRRGQGGILV